MKPSSALALLGIATLARSQPEEQSSRALWDSAFVQQRPAAAPAAAKTVAAPKPVPLAAGLKGDLLGITVWRLRRSAAGDEAGSRVLVHDENTTQEWTPERVSTDKPLAEGQRVRFSIEAAREGYLYIIDREQYSSGALSEPYLLFPTRKIRGGDNRVVPGTVIEVPAWTDSPPYVRLQRSRPDQTAELLTILISPQPMTGFEIGNNTIKLPAGQVAEWEKKWTVRTERLEAPRTAGKTYTSAERKAATDAKPMTQVDPVPQTLYRVEANKDEPLLVNIPLLLEK